MGTLIQGWALAEQGQGEAGIAQIRQGVAALRAAGMRFLGTYHLTLLAEAYDAVGEPEAGLRVLAEALAQVEQTDGSPRASTRSICSRQKRCSKSFQRKAENLITSPIIERACKAFSDEIARMSACQLWLMSDTAHYAGSRASKLLGRVK